MKVLTIGRSEDCDIVIEDNQDLISRKHALLRIYPMGKMELVPLGRNGTYINGLPVKNDKPIKVTRKDVISFAHVKQLDWAMVSDPYRMMRYGIIAAIVAVIGVVLYLVFAPGKEDPKPVQPLNGGANVEQVDTPPAVEVDDATSEAAKPENEDENSLEVFEAAKKKLERDRRKAEEQKTKGKEQTKPDQNESEDQPADNKKNARKQVL